MTRALTPGATEMKMGRERGVLRWEVHAAILQDRITEVEELQAALKRRDNSSNDVAQLTQEVHELRRQLARLGPSPRAKMG